MPPDRPWLVLTPIKWDQEDIQQHMERVRPLVPPHVRLVSSKADWQRYAALEGGFLGWPQRCAARYSTMIAPFMALQSGNSAVTYHALRRGAQVYVLSALGLRSVKAIDWTPGEQGGLLICQEA